MEQPKQQRRYEAAQRRIAKQKELILERLMQTGNIEAACHSVRISRMTYNRWIKEDIYFLHATVEARKIGITSTCDVIESKLVSRASNGDMQAIKFFLSNKHVEYKKPVYPEGETPDIELTHEEEAHIEHMLKYIESAVGDDDETTTARRAGVIVEGDDDSDLDI